MRPIQRLISAGFATAAIVSASVPALAWTVWPDVDFGWYAQIGQPAAARGARSEPAPRPGYIWAPGHYERRGAREAWVAGRWVTDEYLQQLATRGRSTMFATTAAGGPAVR
jgi:hypothetical protein